MNLTLSLTVFTVANAAYEPFVLPYIASVLAHNADAHVEIVLEAPLVFASQNADALQIIQDAFGNRFTFQRNRHQKNPANSHRFIIEPTVVSDYVYIGDIDILVLEAITQPHLRHMNETGLPYSNILRPGRKALTGLHFTRYGAYYPININELPKDYPIGLDEGLLYELVAARGDGLPSLDDKFRPLHGYHLTVNRDQLALGRWGAAKSSMWAPKYVEFSRSTVWQELLPLLDVKYRILLAIFEATLSTAFPELFEGLPVPHGLQVKRLWGMI